MGTKNNPGEYDCYEKLDDDEPFFVLRSTDPAAEFIVAAWVAVRVGDLVGAQSLMDKAVTATEKKRNKRYFGYHSPKAIEAQQCAMTMREWRLGKQLDSIEERLDEDTSDDSQ